MQVLGGDGVFTVGCRDAAENLFDETAAAGEAPLPFSEGGLAPCVVVRVIDGRVSCAFRDFTQVGGIRSGEEDELAVRIDSMLVKELLGGCPRQSDAEASNGRWVLSP